MAISPLTIGSDLSAKDQEAVAKAYLAGGGSASNLTYGGETTLSGPPAARGEEFAQSFTDAATAAGFDLNNMPDHNWSMSGLSEFIDQGGTAANYLSSYNLMNGGSVNLGAPNYTNAAGALASATAGANTGMAVPNYNPDGTQKTQQYDANGLPIKQPVKDRSAEFFKQYMQATLADKPPNYAELYKQSEQDAQLQQKQQEVNNYSAQLNSIQAKAQADQLALTGQGRGIPEVIIGGKQAQIAKEAAIAALPVAAQLAAAQGNLQLAQQHVDTMFKLLSQDAQNQYDFRSNARKQIYEFVTADQKRILDKQDAQEAQILNSYEKFLNVKRQLVNNAYASGAPKAIIDAINSAKNTDEAIAAAGQYNRTASTSGTTGANITTTPSGLASGKTLKSGTLLYTPADFQADTQTLLSYRGKDNWIDPAKYLEALQKWLAHGGLRSDFLQVFPIKDYINPVNTWPEIQALGGGAKSTATATSGTDLNAQIDAAF